MTYDTPNRLRRLTVREISVVGRPAVPGAQIALAKATDPLDALTDAARNYVSKGETAEAVSMAKAGTPAPRAIFKAALDRLAAEIAPGVPPSTQMVLALQHPDGQALLGAINRAPS